MCFLVAIIFGPKRRIGDNWSFFFCCTLTVFVGLLITLFSPLKSEKQERRPDFIVGFILFVLGVLAILGFLLELNNDLYNSPKIAVLMFSIGIAGLGIHLAFPKFLKSVNE